MMLSVMIMMTDCEQMIGRGLRLEHEVNELLYDSGANAMQGRNPDNPDGIRELRDLLSTT